jgi:hypothetical protein
MKLNINLTVLLVLLFCSASGQAIDNLKLTMAEIPEKYKPTDKMLYHSIQAGLFYKQTDLYESFIGKIKAKEFQAFENKDDWGTIYYFEFEDKFEDETFLSGLLWGGKKPTKEHPEEFLVKDNILIIWSFISKSELKKISRDKVNLILNK